jgi:hypothetical protein
MNEPLKGRPPTDEEIFYLEWAKESVKKNIENANAVLAQFLTLNTALIAGGAFFSNEGAVGRYSVFGTRPFWNWPGFSVSRHFAPRVES